MRSRVHNHVRKVCALLATILILPALTFAQGGNTRGNGGGNTGGNGGGNTGGNGGGNTGGNGGGGIRVMPEANAVWVLVPFFGAILLFSSRRVFRAKAKKDEA